MVEILKQDLMDELIDDLVSAAQLEDEFELGDFSQKSSGKGNETKQSASTDTKLQRHELPFPPEQRIFDKDLLFVIRRISKRMEDIGFQQLMDEVARSEVFIKVTD